VLGQLVTLSFSQRSPVKYIQCIYTNMKVSLAADISQTEVGCVVSTGDI
jgi:hypothetical protein